MRREEHSTRTYGLVVARRVVGHLRFLPATRNTDRRYARPTKLAIRECPFCAHDHASVESIARDPLTVALRCSECGATGPRVLGDYPAHAASAWNQRYGGHSSLNVRSMAPVGKKRCQTVSLKVSTRRNSKT